MGVSKMTSSEVSFKAQSGQLISVGFSSHGKILIARRIDILGMIMEDFGWAFDLIEEDYFETVRNIFENEGAWDGRPGWKPLSKDYADAKEDQYPGKKILERTGSLKKSYLMKGAKGNVYRRTKTKLTLGSNLKTPDGKYVLGALHSRGYTRPEIRPKKGEVLRWFGAGGQPVFATRARKVKVPARPIIMPSPEQKARWAKAFHVAFWREWQKKAGQASNV